MQSKSLPYKIEHNRAQRSKDLISMRAVPKDQESRQEPKPVGWGSYDDTMSFDRKGIVLGAKNRFSLGGGGGAAVEVVEGPFIPDMEKRSLMNLILLGSIGASVACLGGPFIYFFYPAISSGGGGGLTAKDANGDDVTLKSWLETHKDGERALVQGLKGDATYLVTEGAGIRDYGINAVCTHLGCVVPWNKAENKYMCPCHGSQYDTTGKVIRGPAPLSLALAHANVDEASNKVIFTPWTETDFRTNNAPWWK
jgi:cytochrome b6-f complex iron-sulfur subunit